MTADPSRKLDPEATRTAILEAAHTHFVARGYAATSMATIAKSAGVTKSLIHHHYGSKRELWDAIKLRALSAYHAQQRELLEQLEPDVSLMAASMEAYFYFLRDNPDVVRLVSWMAVEDDEACTDVLSALTERGLAQTRLGQQKGYLRDDIPAAYLLAPFFTLVRGWFTELPMLRTCVMSDESVGPEPPSERYLRAIIAIFSQGLKPHPPEG